MPAITFPEYGAWMRSDMFGEHLGGHGDVFNPTRIEGCPACVAMSYLPAIRDRWMNGTTEEMLTIWELSDGYGIPGYVPPQGHDWSGIRDSSPAAMMRMAEALGLV